MSAYCSTAKGVHEFPPGIALQKSRLVGHTESHFVVQAAQTSIGDEVDWPTHVAEADWYLSWTPSGTKAHQQSRRSASEKYEYQACRHRILTASLGGRNARSRRPNRRQYDFGRRYPGRRAQKEVQMVNKTQRVGIGESSEQFALSLSYILIGEVT